MSSLKRINSSALSELIVHRKSHIISIILLGISGLTYLNTTMNKGSEPEPYFLSIMFFFFSLCPLFFTCVNVFKDMHDVPSADVQMAMPLSARERFLSKMMTIGYVWFFPFLAFFSFGNIGSSILNSVFQMGYSYSNPAPVPEMIAANMNIMLQGISCSLFIIGVCVLSACCIGSKAESIYLPGILMITISLLPSQTSDFIRRKFANASTFGSSSGLLKIFGFSSIFCDTDEPFYILTLTLNCIFSVLLIFIAMRAYEKRDAKTVGYPVVYKVFFEFVLCSSLAVIFQLIHTNYGVEIIPLFIFYVGSLILRMIVSRKDITLVKILQWTGLFAAYYAVFIVFSFAACVTGGFGMKNITPDTSSFPAKAKYSCCMNFNQNDYQNSSISEAILSEDDVKDIAKICSEYIGKQNRSENFFTDSMIFGFSKHRNKYAVCSVTINSNNPNRDYYGTVYYANIRLTKKDAGELKKKLSSVCKSEDQ